MGFLKFLKREKKEDFDELDLPPAPPPLEGFEENLPELPEIPDFESEKISVKEEDFPKFDFPEKEELPELGKEAPMPEFPEFPEMEEKPMQIEPVSAPQIEMPEPAPQVPEPIETMQPEEEAQPEQPAFTPAPAYPKVGRRLFSHEKIPLREMPTGKTIYVRVDRFKATLGSISMVRSDLRKSEEALTKLENIKSAKDRSFDKVRGSLDDLQKKLIFVDKTLFKGD